MYQLHHKNIFHSEWILYIKNTLIEIGDPFLWESQSVPITKNFKYTQKRKLKDLYTQKWFTQCNEQSSCRNYKIFKDNFKFEEYLTVLPDKLKYALCKFRTCYNNIPVHDFSNHDKSCDLCSKGQTADEFHYILECEHFNTSRRKLITRYFYIRPNAIKLNQLFKSKGKKLFNLAKLCLEILEKLK